MLTTRKNTTPRLIKVLRPFRYNGETLKPGAKIELPEPFAIEMVTAAKAEFAIGSGDDKKAAAKK
jgi:hypothetical protein